MGKNKPPTNNSNVRHLGMGRQTPGKCGCCTECHVGISRALCWWNEARRRLHTGIPFLGHSRKGKTTGEGFCQDSGKRGVSTMLGQHKAHFGGVLMDLFCILIVVVVTQLHEFVKTHRIVHQKVNFTVYKFKMKNFKRNTQNSSFPNYFTVDHYLCSWDYLCLWYLGGGNTTDGAPLLLFPLAPSSHIGGWISAIWCGGSVYTMGTGKCYRSRLDALFCWLSRLKVMRKCSDAH